jgi:hypothetical protein
MTGQRSRPDLAAALRHHAVWCRAARAGILSYRTYPAGEPLVAHRDGSGSSPAAPQRAALA